MVFLRVKSDCRMRKNLGWLKIKDDNIFFDISPTESIAISELPKVVEKVYDYFRSNRVDVVKVSGRGPIWLYSAVVHTVAHLAGAVAVYDAVNGVYVVVVSHTPRYKIGQVLTLKE